MKIVSLQAENIKRLKAVEIRPDGNMVQITGKNAQGKTSVLDAIWLALRVADAKQEKPVRDGEESGRIRLDLGEIIVTRKFKVDKETGETTTSISVTKGDGAKYPSPQAMIDGLLSSLTFDPLHFSRLDQPGQVKALRGLMPGVDFDGTAKSNKEDFDARTEINRKVRDLVGEIAGIGTPIGQRPTGVDKTGLMEQLSKAGEHNALIEKKRSNREKAAEDVVAWRTEAQKKRDEAKAAVEAALKLQEQTEKEATQLEGDANETEKKVAAAGPLGEPIDTEAVTRQLQEADDKNAEAEAWDRREAKKKDLADKEAQSKKLTKAIEDRNAALATAVAATKLPVSGLDFGEDCVLLNGIPFNQASHAEKLRTSAAIAMSLNPKLKVIRVSDGSLLDEDGLALLAKMAEENDYQVWVERVDSSGKVGFVIEDGQLKA